MRPGLCVAAIVLASAWSPPAAAERPRSSAGVTWLLLVDDLHIDFRSTGLVRTWLASVCKELLSDDDVFALRTTGPSGVSVGWLASPADLEAGIRRVSGAALKAEEVRRSPAGSGEIVYRAKAALKAATEFLASAPDQDPRRTVMVFVSKGFDTADPLSDEMQELLTDAWRLNVTVIAIDPSMLPGAQRPGMAPPDERTRARRRDSLERLALPANGFVLADEASLRDAAARISNTLNRSAIRD